MENNLTQLAKIIGLAYRAYDEFPDIDQDADVYLEARHQCFSTMAKEYADVLSRGTVVDQSTERPKSLLRGMLKHVGRLIDPAVSSDEVVDVHWNWIDYNGTSPQDDWIAMENTIYGMIQ